MCQAVSTSGVVRGSTNTRGRCANSLVNRSKLWFRFAIARGLSSWTSPNARRSGRARSSADLVKMNRLSYSRSRRSTRRSDVEAFASPKICVSDRRPQRRKAGAAIDEIGRRRGTTCRRAAAVMMCERAKERDRDVDRVPVDVPRATSNRGASTGVFDDRTHARRRSRGCDPSPATFR